MATGTIKWFNDAKGFGFITPDDESGDVFVHYSTIIGQSGRRTLLEGERVEYEVIEGPKGLQAMNVARTERHCVPERMIHPGTQCHSVRATFMAWRPLGPSITSYSTPSPSRRVRRPDWPLMVE